MKPGERLLGREREYRGGVVDVGPHGAVVERHGRAVIAGELCDCLLSVCKR